MCGRYALALRPSEVRRQLEHSHMPVDEAPGDEGDEGVRQSYNFAPGYHGLVYRADGPDRGNSNVGGDQGQQGDGDELGGKTVKDIAAPSVPAEGHDGTQYKLQAMKWGLIPFWTKRNPDYGSMLKTINCRDDSLIEDRGMWTSMKKKKRCIVVAQGFYEWLKKNNGKEKIPHFTKRKDGQLMCFAGLWDCVQYEDSEEKMYTYAIITTESNKQLNFLHDRMPVILENGSEAVRTWLDPKRTEWSKGLQSVLKPFEGELECYPVSKEVGKVGNNSPSFVIPIDSAANKSNIANFFANQRKAANAKADKGMMGERRRGLEDSTQEGFKMEHDVNETGETGNQLEGTEDNAPLPIPATFPSAVVAGSRGVKREGSEVEDVGDTAAGARRPKRRTPTIPGRGRMQSAATSPATSPAKQATTRSATSNGGAARRGRAAKGEGSRKITSFFGK